MTHPPPTRPEDANRWLGVLALSATVVARSLATALPGAAAGIERWIEATQLAGAILSQAMVVFGAAAAVGLLISTLWRRGLSYGYRLMALPAGAIVLTLVAMSARFPLRELETQILAAAASALAVAAAVIAMRNPRSRAAGLVLLGAAASAALELAAHHATAAGKAPHAAAIAAVAFAADALSLALASAWLLTGPRRVLRPLVLGTALAAAVVAWGAARGSMDGASLWQVLASKALGDITARPPPLVALPVAYWVDAHAFGVALLLLAHPRWVGPLPTAMSLALVVRGSADIPLCALMLALSALLTALGTDTRRTEAREASPDAPAEAPAVAGPA